MPGNGPKWLPRRSLDSKHFVSTPTPPPLLRKFFQNRFWSLEKLFCLYELLKA
eukprot:UN23104